MFGHYYAATEVPIVIEYDPNTLETLSRFDLGKIISDVRLITAHPLYESDGTMWNIASATGLDSKGQLISKFSFGVIIWIKIPTKNLTSFCPRI